MLLNQQNMDAIFNGFKAVYTDAFSAAPSNYEKVSMVVPSGAREETYGWLGQFPKLREWIGPREIKGFEDHSFTIKNRKFESTVRIIRDDFSDDRFGIYKPMFAEMGHTARQHPDEMVFNLLRSGFDVPSYDGQSFFDAEHPTRDENNIEIAMSNLQDGAETPWFLLDTSRAIKPLIWQEREPYEFQMINGANDYNVVMLDEYIYGIRSRVNAGFGLWQLAFGSRQPLTAENYANARASMMMTRGDQGRLLGVLPNTLVVPPSLESDALAILNTEVADSTSNVWRNTAELIVTPHVAT